jgi:hypothetical protein
MNMPKAQKIWIEQCDAAPTIKARFGLTAAFDYLIGEKLISFASAASRHPDFAQELPRFVSEVRRMFTPDEIGAQLAQIEYSQTDGKVDVLEEEDDDDLLREVPAAVAEFVQQFMLVKELLTAPMLGTS